MFLNQFIENLFSNSENRSAPSFAIPFILAWLYVNDAVWKEFLSVTGTYSIRLSRALDNEIYIVCPAAIAIAIVVISPFIKNSAIFINEFADDLLKKIMKKREIKIFKSAAEYDLMHEKYENMKNKYQGTEGELEKKEEEYNDQKRELENEINEKKSELDRTLKDFNELSVEKDNLQKKIDLVISRITTWNVTNGSIDFNELFNEEASTQTISLIFKSLVIPFEPKAQDVNILNNTLGRISLSIWTEQEKALLDSLGSISKDNKADSYCFYPDYNNGEDLTEEEKLDFKIAQVLILRPKNEVLSRNIKEP